MLTFQDFTVYTCSNVCLGRCIVNDHQYSFWKFFSLLTLSRSTLFLQSQHLWSHFTSAPVIKRIGGLSGINLILSMPLNLKFIILRYSLSWLFDKGHCKCWNSYVKIIILYLWYMCVSVPIFPFLVKTPVFGFLLRLRKLRLQASRKYSPPKSCGNWNCKLCGFYWTKLHKKLI